MKQEVSNDLLARIVALETLVLDLARDSNSVELQKNFAFITAGITRSLSMESSEGMCLAEQINIAQKKLACQIPRNV